MKTCPYCNKRYLFWHSCRSTPRINANFTAANQTANSNDDGTNLLLLGGLLDSSSAADSSGSPTASDSCGCDTSCDCGGSCD